MATDADDAVTTKPKFVATQRLVQLNCPKHEEPTKYLSDEALQPFSSDNVRPPTTNTWSLIENREAFLGGLELRRLVLTETGGIGKTTALEQLEYLRSVCHHGHLCIRIEAAELPEAPECFLGAREENADSDTPPLLIKQFRTVYGADTLGESLDGRQIRRLILRKIRQGHFSLLVDALDQMELDPKAARKKVKSLALFLSQHADRDRPELEIGCAVTGRPYAVTSCWSELRLAGRWQFIAAAPFTVDEQKEYLTEGRWELLQQLETKVLSVPRALERLRELPEGCLTSLETAADVYRESIRTIISKGIEKQTTEFDETAAIRWFALLAFEMHRQGRFVCVPLGDAFDRFLKDLLKNRKVWLKDEYGISNLQQLRNKLTLLNQLNIAMENAVTVTDGVSRIRWHDRTLQDFFAAVWCTRYADDVDYACLAEMQCRRNTSEVLTRVVGDTAWETRMMGLPSDMFYGELKRLLCGMPRHTLQSRAGSHPTPDAAVFDDAHYVRSVAPFYRADIGRETEFIYRSWVRLTEIAAYDDAPDHKSQQFKEWLQANVWRRVESKQLTFDPWKPLSPTAVDASRDVCEQYLAEFPSLVLGLSGPSSNQRIAKDLHHNGYGDRIETGEFTYGEGTASISRPYRLSKCLLSNNQMDLFRYGIDKEVHPTPDIFDHPHIAHTNWYDANAAADWFHASLPCEHAFECASRGELGRNKRWIYGFFETGCSPPRNDFDVSEGGDIILAHGHEITELTRRVYLGFFRVILVIKEPEEYEWPEWAGNGWSRFVEERGDHPYKLVHLLHGDIWTWTRSSQRDDMLPESSAFQRSRVYGVLRGGIVFRGKFMGGVTARVVGSPDNRDDAGTRLLRWA